MSLIALTLSITDYRDPDHWRWVLTDEGGAFLADHEVALDTKAAEHSGWIDLPAYLDHYGDRDRRVESHQALLDGFGRWLDNALFGGKDAKFLSQGTPAVIRVELPPEADGLMARPFEAAHVAGTPLPLQDLSLVFTVKGEAPVTKAAPVSGSLRILAVFSLPPEGSPLNLRAERQMLKRLVKTLTGSGRNAAIELRVLQYGTTRQVLEDALDEGEGWDIVHFSSHGTAGVVVLEKDDGTADVVNSGELAKLLRLARRRVKLVTLSACLSAAATVEETLRWLGLSVPVPLVPRRDAEAGTAVQPAVARALVRELDCGVLAMRFSVEDGFAIELAENLYEKLLQKDQMLPRALQRGLAETKGQGGHGPLSLVTPTLFGARAAGLTVKAPKAPPQGFEVPSTGLYGFDPEPPHFVGRVMAMTRASAALAPDSGRTGVLFHGMAGGGKTACALELAYHVAAAQRFQNYLFWKAPDQGSDISSALLNLASALENKLDGFAMTHVVGRRDELTAWLPRLTALLEERGLLLVLDNLESLLTAEGRWRDDNWRLVMGALLGHRGLSRTVLTSRVPPAALPDTVEVVPVHRLSLAEAVLLMRQLPNLGRLLRGTDPERGLVLRTLRLVQGHPKLIDLAEAQAADPARLKSQIETAEAAQIDGGAALDTFFREGQSDRSAEQFLTDLARWTNTAAATLSEASRTLFHFLCCLEEGDREKLIVAQTWPMFVGTAEGAAHQDAPKAGSSPAAPAAALHPLTAAGLVEVNAGGDKPPTRYLIHPGVAEAGRLAAGPAVRDRVDRVLGNVWYAMFLMAEANQTQGGGPMIIRAGLAAAPYLMRRQDWDRAGPLLERVVLWDQHPATLAAVLPLMDRIADATAGTDRELIDRFVLAKILMHAGRIDEAEQAMRAILDGAEARGQWRIGSGVASDLINLLRATGRAEAALALADKKQEFTRRAGLGPWTQLRDEGGRLQLLAALVGRAEEVFDAVEALRPRMAALPDTSDQEEAALPWSVRETILHTGLTTAVALERWQPALDLNAEILKSLIARGATALEQARTRCNDYGPLLRLNRFPEARAVLDQCRTAFEDANDLQALGVCLSALADLEARLGHLAEARGFEERALRPIYLAGDPESCAISHFNLADSIMRGPGTPAEALAHRLAAVLLGYFALPKDRESDIHSLVTDVRHLGPAARSHAPAGFDALCRTVEAIEGVRFREAFTRLAAPKGLDGDALLKEVLNEAFKIAGMET